MAHLPKVSAFITARSGRLERDGVSLRRIFRRTRRGLNRLSIYVELGELMVGHDMYAEIRVVDSADQLLWEPMDVEEVVRFRQRELLFQMEGPRLKSGVIAVQLFVNGILADIRQLTLE